MNDDDDDGHEDECYCVGCQLNRQIKQFQKQNIAIGAANARRGFWTDVYLASINSGLTNHAALTQANDAVRDLDKAFPEVLNAAMDEDR